ncbi:MAG TPA: universal stress protein [Thermoanaerobaculia bacterium]|nr:universal stress protein [Thermoanaerobaculia bacterium]
MANTIAPQLRVLLPLKPKDDLGDLTRVLRAILAPGATHARRLYVHRPVETEFFIPETYARLPEIAQLEFDAENATRAETEREMEPLAAAGFGVSAEVVRGIPTEEVLREASLWRADLVVARTRSAMAQDRKIGGMAAALLHHATCGVLLYRDVPPDYRVRHVLIPTDFSSSARQSADWGLALADVTGAQLYLLHVIARWNNRHGIHQDELLNMAAAELERWQARGNSLPGRLIEHGQVLEASTPAEGILDYAQKKRIDLIVMSATGLSAVRAALLGSNTRKVVRASPCPVLVIPTFNRVSVQSFLDRARFFQAEPELAQAWRCAG